MTFIWFWVQSWWMLERIWLHIWFSVWIYSFVFVASLIIQTEITKLSLESLTSSHWDWAALRLSSVEVCKTLIGGDAAILVWIIQMQRWAHQDAAIDSSSISHSSLRFLRNRLIQRLWWVCIEWICWISLRVNKMLLLVRRLILLRIFHLWELAGLENGKRLSGPFKAVIE